MEADDVGGSPGSIRKLRARFESAGAAAEASRLTSLSMSHPSTKLRSESQSVRATRQRFTRQTSADAIEDVNAEFHETMLPRRTTPAFSIEYRSERAITICRKPSIGAAAPEIVIDVPHLLIDCLANDMPRVLQLFRHWDSGRTGEISIVEFEHILFALGVRYTIGQVRRLFRVLDADSNGRVSLAELLLLKFAIDHHISDLPARPGMRDSIADADDGDEASAERRGGDADATVTLRIEDVDAVATGRGFGVRFCNALAKPMLGAVWKAQYRPHHALALDQHLEHTRGPATVHTRLRVCRRPELGTGFHVALQLVPLRGEALGERVRYIYRAGSAPSAVPFCARAVGEIRDATQRAVMELQELLGEVRQLDVQLEEVRLLQRGSGRDADEGAVQSLVELKRLLIALAVDTEEAVIAHTRYTSAAFRPKHLVRGEKILRFSEGACPPTPHATPPCALWRTEAVHDHPTPRPACCGARRLPSPLPTSDGCTGHGADGRAAHCRTPNARHTLPRFTCRAVPLMTRRSSLPAAGSHLPTSRCVAELSASEKQRRRLHSVARLSGGVLALTALMQVFVQAFVWDDAMRRNHAACEFQRFACSRRPWQYACSADGHIALLANRSAMLRYGALDSMGSPPPDEPCSAVVAPFPWGDSLIGVPCDRAMERRSLWFLVPLPLLLLAAVILPIGTFYRNVHRITVNKVLLWTPSVPLILLQCVFRTAVLLSVVPDASDTVFALNEGLTSAVLTMQVAVFVFMDAMRFPTPMLRIGFALALLVRFGFSLILRSTMQLSEEQAPLAEQGSAIARAFEAFASTPKQSVISSVDWTIVAMLSSSILSVVNYPGEMAVVRLRCDTRRYFNWRDQYLAAMEVRASRRDLDYADHALWFRAKLPLWIGRQRQSVRAGVEQMAAAMGGMVSRTRSHLAPRSSTTRPAMRGGADANGQRREAATHVATSFGHSAAHFSDRV